MQPWSDAGQSIIVRLREEPFGWISEILDWRSGGHSCHRHSVCFDYPCARRIAEYRTSFA
jgi:hypothetical protein